MGVDYNGVGGIGVRLSPEMVKTAIEKNMFTEKDLKVISDLYIW